MAAAGTLLRRAKKTGVKPFLSAALTLAPCASSHLMVSVLPAIAAHISGVWAWTLAASTAAPLACIAASTSGVAAPAHSAKAVVPSARTSLALAPALSRALTMTGLPSSQAREKGSHRARRQGARPGARRQQQLDAVRILAVHRPGQHAGFVGQQRVDVGHGRQRAP